MSFICMRMKNDFHIKCWAPTLVLKQRLGELGNGLLVSLSVFSLIEAICLKILAKPLLENAKQLLPTDVFHSKSPLARVPIVARVSWMYLVYILSNWSKPSAIHYSNKGLSKRCFLFSEQSGRLFLVFQGTQGKKEVKTRVINCYQSKIKTVAGVIIRGSIYKTKASWTEQMTGRN